MTRPYHRRNPPRQPALEFAELLDSQVAADLSHVDTKMLSCVRKIARGEPIVEEKAAETFNRLMERAKLMGLPVTKNLIELVRDAFDSGAASTVKPIPILKAFEALIHVGHPELWAPQDGKSKGPKTLILEVSGMDEPRQLLPAIVIPEGSDDPH